MLDPVFDGHREGLLYEDSKGNDVAIAEYLGDDENQDPC